LQYQNVVLSEKAGLPDADIEGVRDMLTTFFAASDGKDPLARVNSFSFSINCMIIPDIWLPLLGTKSKRFNAHEISASDLEDHFLRAERDYLCKSVYSSLDADSILLTAFLL
jgi:hypothetical protein